MLEYTKTILQKVEFSDLLFKKELAKSLKWLTPGEKEELLKWVKENYGGVAYRGSVNGDDFPGISQKVL